MKIILFIVLSGLIADNLLAQDEATKDPVYG